jgi:hypothetical protein
MSQRAFSLIAAAAFLLIALLRAVRLLFDWHVTVESVVVPVLISWIGLAVATYLACQAFRSGRSETKRQSELRDKGTSYHATNKIVCQVPGLRQAKELIVPHSAPIRTTNSRNIFTRDSHPRHQ